MIEFTGQNAPEPATIVPLSDLPRLTASQVRFDRLSRRINDVQDLAARLLPELPIKVGMTEVSSRPSGLSRPGVNVQLAWPRLDSRIGLGVETPIAHALVDLSLGFERLPAENDRQVTPVEFGVLTFIFARALDRLDARPGPFGPWDLKIDRVGSDPFDVRDLGPVLTWRWPVQVGRISGSIRLWLSESLLNRLEVTPSQPVTPRPEHLSVASTWTAEAGTITLPRGIARLKVGGVLPIDGGTLKGTVASPEGPIRLVCHDRQGRSQFDIEPVPKVGAFRVSIRSPLDREPTPREPIPLSASPSIPTPVELPVTLVVELGRVSIPLSRLADLKPGDVIELGRHSREPVELTSNGKLVARGELVQIDTELGIRLLNVLM